MNEYGRIPPLHLQGPGEKKIPSRQQMLVLESEMRMEAARLGTRYRGRGGRLFEGENYRYNGYIALGPTARSLDFVFAYTVHRKRGLAWQVSAPWQREMTMPDYQAGLTYFKSLAKDAGYL